MAEVPQAQQHGVSLMSVDELEPVVAGETPLYSKHFPNASVLICKITVISCSAQNLL